MRCRKRPCEECPFRKDTPPGQFPRERYAALRRTAPREDGTHPRLGDPLFACHKSAEGEEIACAGWLAVCGRDHVTVRLALAQGDLELHMVEPPDDWPELHKSYDEMMEAQAA